jgi:hypothetical protein
MLPDFDGWELNHIVTLILIGVLLVVRVPMILDLRLLLIDDVLGALEEVRNRILLVVNANIHLALVLNHLLFQEVI